VSIGTWLAYGDCRINSPAVAHENDYRVKLQNRLVNFRVADVHFPEPEKVLAELYGRHLLQGRVTGVTNDGVEGGRFAIVEVDGIEKPVFVPIDRILGILA
jgi:hypothetical protein